MAAWDKTSSVVSNEFILRCLALIRSLQLLPNNLLDSHANAMAVFDVIERSKINTVTIMNRSPSVSLAIVDAVTRHWFLSLMHNQNSVVMVEDPMVIVMAAAETTTAAAGAATTTAAAGAATTTTAATTTAAAGAATTTAAATTTTAATTTAAGDTTTTAASTTASTAAP